MNITNHNYNTSKHYNTSFGKFQGVILHKEMHVGHETYGRPYKDFFKTHKETMVQSLKTIKESAWFQNLCEKFDDVKLQYNYFEFTSPDPCYRGNDFTLNILYRNKNKGFRNFLGRLFGFDWQEKNLSYEKNVSRDKIAKTLMNDISNKDKKFLSDLEYVDYDTRCKKQFELNTQKMAEDLEKQKDKNEYYQKKAEAARKEMEANRERDKALDDEWNKYAQ